LSAKLKVVLRKLRPPLKTRAVYMVKGLTQLTRPQSARDVSSVLVTNKTAKPLAIRTQLNWRGIENTVKTTKPAGRRAYGLAV
jgi:hypothetical protein